MELFYSVFYPIRLVLCLILFAVFFARRKNLHHADFMMFVMMVGVFTSAIKLASVYFPFLQGAPIHNLFYCSLASAIITGYSVDMQLPGWLTTKKQILLLLFPAIILTITILSRRAGVVFETYDSYSACMDDAEQYQIWIRFVMVFILWGQYWLEVMIPRLTIRHFDAPLWFDIYAVIFFIYIFSFGISVFYPSNAFRLAQTIYITVYASVVSYLELFTHVMDPKRISVTTHIQQDYQTFKERIDPKHMNYLENNVDNFYKVEAIVMERALYQDANLTLHDLASEVKVPSNSLENILKTAGYAGFSHFIGKCRVVALKQLLLKNNGRNAQELYSQVGFTNRAAASRYFKLFTGLTPTEWVKQEKHTLYNN